MRIQKTPNIEHEDCTFYVYSVIHEWSYFSGKHCEIDRHLNGHKIDDVTGYLHVTFKIEKPDYYFVQCIVHQDVRGLEIDYVTLQLQTIFYQQLLHQQQEQQVATLQLMGALNSSLKIKPLLQATMDYAFKALPVIDRGFLMLYDDILGKLYTVASQGVTESIFNYEPDVGEGMAGYTFKTGISRIYTYKETQKIMWNVSDKNLKALMEAIHLGSIEHNTSMAVPITFEGRKFGVMIVHQYTNKRPFQSSDLRLLESFASQAAVALRNAEAYEQIELLNADYQKQGEIYKMYVNLSLQDVSNAKIIKTTKQLLQCGINYINLMDRKTFLPNEEMHKLAEIKEPCFVEWHQHLYIYPVQNEQDLFGYMMIKIGEEPTKLQQMILGNASVSLTLKALQLLARNQQSSKERYELFQYLLSGKAALNDTRYEELHLDIRKPTFVLSFKILRFSNKVGQQFIQYIEHHFTAQRFIFLQRDRITWVLQGDDQFRERLIAQLPGILDSWLKFYDQSIAIGVGTIQSNLLQIKQSIEESEQAIHHEHFAEVLTIVSYENLGINRLFGKQTVAEIQLFVDQVLAPIMDSKDNVLCQTLMTYVFYSCSVSRTASALHIHQNTLYHRLGKIEQLLGKQLSNPQHFLEVNLALHLYKSIY